MKILYGKNTPCTWGKKSAKAINTVINFSETTGLMRKKKREYSGKNLKSHITEQ